MVRTSRSHSHALLSFLTVLFPVLLNAAEPKLPTNFLPLPLYKQETSYSCGPASFLSILRYWSAFSGTEKELYPILQTSEKEGTNPRMILKAALDMKLVARMEENVTIEKLRDSFAKGETVILDLQAWKDGDQPWKDTWNEGHYIVMAAIDGEYLYAMDPSVSEKFGYIPLMELYDRWHDVENENGKEWKNYQLAIFMKGVTPGKPFTPPEKLEKIN